MADAVVGRGCGEEGEHGAPLSSSCDPCVLCSASPSAGRGVPGHCQLLVGGSRVEAANR